MTHEQHPSLGQITVGSILRTSAARYEDREALFCAGTGRRFTFRQLNSRSNQLAHALMGLSLERGAVVAFVCSNRAEILDIYVALAKSGLVGLPLNYRLAPAEMSTLIEAMGAVAIICEARFGDVLNHLRAHSPALRHYVWIGPDAPKGCHSYDELLSTGSTSEPQVEIDERAPYYFNLTSGTTGLPKSYVLTQYSVCFLHAGLLAQDARPDDVYLTVFPAFGRLGLGSLLMSIMTGARNVLVNFEPATTLGLIETESVTFIWLVATMAALLLAVPHLDSRKLKSLRAVGFVGAMLPASIREQTISRLCTNIYEGYGLQEIGMLTISTPADRQHRADSVGRPVLFTDVRIVDTADKDVAVGEIGEIVGRSPSTITAYYQSPARNTETFRGGWFHTGDLGRLDEAGYLYLCGRVKDMIVSGGQNVHSSEIEATLLGLPGVIDCAVVGLPHEIWGEVVSAVIVAQQATALDMRQVQDFCRKTLASFKVPRHVVFQQEALPRTPTGKVQKFILVERYRSTLPPLMPHAPDQ